MTLKKGDEIRIIAPSKGISSLSDDEIVLAKEKLEQMGFKVSFGKNVTKRDSVFKSASIEDRISDLHEAFLDKNVKCIIAARGGYNSNQLLKHIDYDVIKKNPKIICGFSDITALLNTIYKKTNMITFCGPLFSSFAMKKGFDYTEDYFEKMLLNDESVKIISSKEYSDDNWFVDQKNRTFIKNEGMYVVNEGSCSGKIIGGNLCTLNLLQGTEFFPSLDNTVLFLEDDDFSGDNFLYEFDRNLESLIQTENFKGVKGIVFGRCQEKSNMNTEKWISLIKNKKELLNMPIIINANFGHTTPIFTFPIGGKCNINATSKRVDLNIKK